jgi:hypothetical protein
MVAAREVVGLSLEGHHRHVHGFASLLFSCMRHETVSPPKQEDYHCKKIPPLLQHIRPIFQHYFSGSFQRRNNNFFLIINQYKQQQQQLNFSDF